MKRIGLIGGAGMYYYEKLAAAFVDRGAQPGFVVSHADIGRAYTMVQQGEMDALAAYLNEHLATLKNAGCEIAAIAAVTPLICWPQLKPIAALPIVDVFDCVNAELAQRNAKRIGILGTQFVMQSDMFGRLQDVDIMRLTPEELDLVQRNYLIIARTGNIAYADIEAIRAIAKRLTEAGADVVILAGTELSLAFDEATAGFPALDSGRVHVNAIVEAALV
jgi:aspartate racemase